MFYCVIVIMILYEEGIHSRLNRIPSAFIGLQNVVLLLPKILLITQVFLIYHAESCMEEASQLHIILRWNLPFLVQHT